MNSEQFPPDVFLRTYHAPTLASTTVPDVLRLARGMGCTCHPDVVRRGPGWRIAHDDWCELVEEPR
jgi:hypothetical protein